MDHMDDIWPDISPSQKRDAHYQAGHAIIALRESLEVIRISIENTDGLLTSWIDILHPDLSHGDLSTSSTAYTDAKAVIRSLLAGPAASLRYSFGVYPRDCAPPEFDLADPWMAEQEAVWRAVALAGKISEDSPSLIRHLWGEVNGLIQGEAIWHAIEAVANLLLITGELAGCEVRDVARHAMRPNATWL